MSNTTSTSIEPMRRAGTKANPGKSKTDQLKKAINCFDAFVCSYSLRNSSALANKRFDNLLEADLSEELLECLMGYLEDKYKFNTSRSYFGSLKIAFANRFPVHEKMLSTRNWEGEFHRHYNKVSQETGEAIQDHSFPVNADDHHLHCQYMFEQNLHEECALDAMDWHNAGRINEGPKLKWDTSIELHDVYDKFSNISCMWLKWRRGKTGALSATYNFPHAYDWLVCTFHALARYIVLVRSVDEFLFPVLAGQSLSSHMNRIYSEAYKRWRQTHDAGEEQRKADRRAGRVAVERTVVMTAGLKTHGNRSGPITQARSTPGLLTEGIEQRAGIKTSSSYSTVNCYDSVTWDRDSKVNIY